MEPVDVRGVDGSVVGSATLDEGFFGHTPNVPLMHQVVTAQLAAARRGTQSTLTRAEVSGGGAKPFRQKGTGRARAGSSRSPNWTGGGVALGPKPRSYRQRTPKKMIRGALLSALSDRAAGGKIIVVRDWPWSVPSTKEAVKALRALETDGRVVIVVAPDDAITIKSFRNLTDVHLLPTTELNAYDVLCSDWLIFTEATLPGAHIDTAPVGLTKRSRVTVDDDDTAGATASPPATAGPAAANLAKESQGASSDVTPTTQPAGAQGSGAAATYDPFAEPESESGSGAEETGGHSEPEAQA